MPTFTVIAGPNGSGKSTMTGRLGLELGTTLLDPDAIARSINPETPEKAALQAGRTVLQLLKQRLHDGESTTIETTLSAGQNLEWMRTASSQGFRVELFYVSLASPLLNQTRVTARVRKGGHFVPMEDIKRRFERSMKQLPEALMLADFAVVFDNTHKLRKVLEFSSGQLRWKASRLPAWVHRALKTVLEESS